MELSERRAFSYPLYAGLQLLLILAITVQPTRFRRLLFLPILAIAFYLLYYTTTGVTVTDLAIGSSIPPMIATALDYILLSTPQIDLYENGQTTPAASFPSFWSRLAWSLRLLSSQRGVGWTHEPRELLPPRPYASNPSKKRFVVTQMMLMGLWLVAWDAAATYVRHRPTFRAEGEPETEALRKYFFMLAWMTPAWAALSVNHGILSLVMVLCGFWDLRTWRPFFGSFAEAYTVRRFWSRTWHQLIRRSVIAPGKRINRILGIKKESTMGYLIVLFVSFYVSGYMHSTADYMLMGHHGGAMKFFMLQAISVAVEGFVLKVARRWGARSNIAWYILGYIWVQLWFCVTLPIYIDPQNRAGVSEANVLRVSVIEPLLITVLGKL